MASGLPLRWAPNFDQDKFYTSASNQDAYDWLQRDQWPVRHMWISGPQGCGKTHLASIWAQHHQAQWLTAHSLAYAKPHPFTVVDWGGEHPSTMDQSALYPLLMQMDACGGRGVWLSRHTPGDWSSPWLDVVSRIRAMMHTEIGPPDDALLGHVLRKRLSDRGWKWPERLIALVLQRMVRSCEGIGLLMHYMHQQEGMGHRVGCERDVLQAIQWVHRALQQDWESLDGGGSA